MIPDTERDVEFTTIPYDGIIVFSKREPIVPENRGRFHFDLDNVRLISSSIRKVRKKVFEF
jgi:hypothetical protein